jgi:hypothetical protein
VPNASQQRDNVVRRSAAGPAAAKSLFPLLTSLP